MLKYFLVNSISLSTILFGQTINLVDNSAYSLKSFVEYNDSINIIVKQKIQKLIAFNNNNIYNESIAFLVDYHIPSKNYRFFIVNLQTQKIIKRGLVSHGDCNDFENNYFTPRFSNIPNSKCSSLGIYSVGAKYISKMWGTAYRLNGLESTNNNALKRGIVMHAHSQVPYSETGNYINTSYGCPMMNIKFFKELQITIDSTTKDILFWAYY